MMFGLVAVSYGMIFTLFCLSGMLCWMSYSTYKASKLMLKKAEAKAKLIEARAKAQVNKLTALPLAEFNAYLEKLLDDVLITEATAFVSENDPKRIDELTARALVALINYLEDNLKTIEYYYGANYIFNWFTLRMRIMNQQGKLIRIVETKHVPMNRRE